MHEKELAQVCTVATAKKSEPKPRDWPLVSINIILGGDCPHNFKAIREICHIKETNTHAGYLVRR